MTIEIPLYFCRPDFVGHFEVTANHWRHNALHRMQRAKRGFAF